MGDSDTRREGFLGELAQLGPGLLVCIPQSKEGYDGGPLTIRALGLERNRQAARMQHIQALSSKYGITPEDTWAAEPIALAMDGLMSPSGAYIWDARNHCVRELLGSPKHAGILWIDGDMEWIPEEVEALRRDLVEHPEFDMIGGLVSTRTRHRLPCIYGWDEEQQAFPRITTPPTGIMEIDGLGCAFTAVRRELYEAMAEVGMTLGMFYAWVYALSEDLYFCLHARKHAGARIAVDGRIRPRHVGLHGFRCEEMDGATLGQWIGRLNTAVDQVCGGRDAMTTSKALWQEEFNWAAIQTGDDEIDRQVRGILQGLHSKTRKQVLRELHAEGLINEAALEADTVQGPKC